MFSLLRKFKTGAKDRRDVAPATESPKLAQEWVPVYPPVDPGLPSSPVAGIIHAQRELISRIKTAACVGDEQFESQFVVPIKAIAAYIHLLPASAHEHFSGPGGLFRLCVEKAFYCLQAADGRIFTPLEDVETRHMLEPRWRYAAFLGGLVSEIYRPLALAVVTDDQGNQWPKFTDGLASWLQERGLHRFYVTWQKGVGEPSGAEGASVLGKIIPKEQLSWMDEGTPTITRELFRVALGKPSHDSILGNLIESIREGVLKRDLATRRSRYGHLRIGNHLEPYILDVIRARIESDQWKVNVHKTGPVFYGSDGLFVEWPAAAKDVRGDLLQYGVAGVPKSAATFVEMLGCSGAISPDPDGKLLWSLTIPLPEGPRRTTAIKFADPATALGYAVRKCEPRPFSSRLVEQSEQQLEAPPSLKKEPLGAAPPPVPANAPAEPVHSSEAAVLQREGTPPVGQQELFKDGDPRISEESAPKKKAVPVPPRESPASDVSHDVRQLLKPVEAEMIGWWIRMFKTGKSECVVELSRGRVAISTATLVEDGVDVSKALSMLESRGWLGRGDWSGKGLKVAPVQFGDSQKPAFVLSGEAAKQLGFVQ